MSQPNITLYTAQTPNGIKISMALEELGYSSFVSALKLVLTCHSLPYKVEKIDMSKNTQKEEYVIVSHKY
jgi:glutathione S-transferase